MMHCSILIKITNETYLNVFIMHASPVICDVTLQRNATHLWTGHVTCMSMMSLFQKFI